MTDEAKKIVEELRESACKGCIHDKIGRCMYIQQGKFCGSERHKAADLIEKLASQLEEERANHQQTAKCAMRLVDDLNKSLDRESGLHIMLTSAQSAAETWERKYKEVLSKLETTTREWDAAENGGEER